MTESAGETQRAGGGSTAAPSAPTAGRSLTFRIVAYLTLALLPLGLVAVIQSLQAIDAARQSYRSALAAQTVRAARPEAEAILRVLGIARGLTFTVPELLDDPERCAAAMARVSDDHPRIAFAGFVDMDQTTTCNSAGERYDFSGNADSDRVFDAGVTDVTFNPSGNVSEEAVVIISVPVREDLTGVLLGFVSLSFPTRPLVEAREAADLDASVSLATFDGRGRILTSDLDTPQLEGRLPESTRLSDLSGRGQQVFTERSADGALRDYAVTPIVPGTAYALGIWDTPDRFRVLSGLTLRSVAFPIMMWLASLVVAIWALQRLAIAPIRKLSLRMRAFADRRTMFQANTLADAPLELQQIGAVFETMVNTIVRDEAALEDRLHERDVLLREVHHRVKNNLQLMSSIINMQVRQSTSDEAADALRRVQGRLASLAKFHQDLYETSSLSQLRADQLIEDLARQMVAMNADPRRQVGLRLDLDPVVLPPDLSGPLAMLVTEALTNALKYGSAGDGKPLELTLSLKESGHGTDRRVRAEIANSVAAETEVGTDGLGTRLIRAFAGQLGAEFDLGIEDGRYVLRLSFAVPPPRGADAGT